MGIDAEMQKKLEIFKSLVKELHGGKDVNSLKKKFGEVLKTIKPWEIPFLEQQLLKDGISVFEIVRFCDLHVELFRDSVATSINYTKMPTGHPLRDLYLENQEILKDAEKINLYLRLLDEEKETGEIKKIISEIKRLIQEFFGIKKHFIREQLLIFPYIEKRGITAVPRVLWTKQDQLINKVKKFYKEINSIVDQEELQKKIETLKREGLELSREMIDMVFRENNILYPTLNVLLSEGEWLAIKENSKEIGYYKIKSGNSWKPKIKPIYPYEITGEITKEQLEKLPPEIRTKIDREKIIDNSKLVREEDINLEDGYLSKEEINAILKTLPIDISFIDKNNTLRYYNKTNERIFPRAKTVLGRKVQLCHPPRSVEIVEKIINEFKQGTKNQAEFWINMRGRLIHIRYFPVRDKKGNYVGTLEVVQDITEIKKIEGEKRLLEW